MISVVIFHAFEQAAPGGFIGVDVFFVISGFVITRSLLSEYQQKTRIDLWAFWTRRVRRILPSSSAVLLTIACVGALEPRLDPQTIGKDIIAAALFVVNYRFAAQAQDYLGIDHSDDPVLHFWSLSVEEQFYLFWPPALLGVIRYSQRQRFSSAAMKRMLVIFVAIIAMISLAYSVILVSTRPSFAFFDTFSRAWQLLSGAFLALTIERAKFSARLAHGMGLAGFAVLLLFVSAYQKVMPYPGAWALVPVFGSASIILAGTNVQSVSYRLLSGPRLRYIGRVSFAWYLWHWPFLIFGKMWLGASFVTTIALIMGSFAAASLTHHALENPVRYAKGRLASKPAATLLGLCLIGLPILSGVALRFVDFNNIEISKGQFASQDSIKRDWPFIYHDGCLRRFNDNANKACTYGAPQGPTVVLLGDSHAGNWVEPLVAAAEQEGWRVVVRIKAACRPTDELQNIDVKGVIRTYPECTQWLQSVKSEIETIKPNLVIVGSTSQPSSGEKPFIDSLAAFAPLVLVRGTPMFPRTTLDCLKSRTPGECSWPLDRVLPNNVFPTTPAEDLPKNVTVLDLNDSICPGRICRPVVHDKVTMFDNHHLSKTFSLTLTPIFSQVLKNYQVVSR